MLTPYQYASNNPILNVDIDGLEGLEYIHVMNQHETQMAKKTPEERRRIENQAGLTLLGITGLVGVMVVAPEAAPFISSGLASFGATGTSTAAAVGLWLQQPQNQQLLAEGGAFIAGVIDPNPTAQYYPAGAGDELGNFVGGLFRTGGKQVLNYVFRSSALDEATIGSAKLVDDVLELDIQITDNLKGDGLASQLVNDALNQFGDKVKKIQGLWLEGDNLKAFNESIKGGKSVTEAVFSTATGKIAKRNGFNKLDWNGTNSDFNADNTAEALQVFFTKE